MLDFGALAGGSGNGTPVLEPRKIFTTLVRDSRFKFPSANQGEVLDKWFDLRNRRDNTIKMNTGSGKMLVGLLALQSSLNEGIGPALYVVPDNYLLHQVMNEARDLGIHATDDANDSEFLAGRSILVANIHKLVNGKSVFGVGDVRKPIGAVVIDDAHACLATVDDQFSISLDSTHPAYDALIALFEEDLKAQSELRLVELKAEDPQAIMLVPFWAWYDKRGKLLEILHSHRDDDDLLFKWPLLKEVIPYCQCVISGTELEISPRCVPIERITSFERAKRRIYMTATLADDGVLVTKLNADPTLVVDPIKPKGAGEIGDRMIVVPQEINGSITDDEIKALAAQVAVTKNVAVIVPSEKRANYWADVAHQTLKTDTIANGIDRLKRGEHVGITVLVNRYDGVDLPDDACRLLIIDGLPEFLGLASRIETAALEGTDVVLLRQVQKLEQGMGRGVRSSEDRCAVLLLGNRLAQKINQPNAREMFTPATLAQIELGREVTQQVKGQPASALRPLLDYCMDGHTEWWQTGRARLAHAPEGPPSRVDSSIILQREAFDLLAISQFKPAEDKLQQAVNAEADRSIKGYLKQQLAEIAHLADPVAAQTILLSAVGDNRRIIKPIAGIAHVKITAPASQAAASAAFMASRFLDPNMLILFTNALADDLTWGEDSTDKFEAAMKDLGDLLGFGSQRPDNEYRDGGPDNLWAVGGLHFYVIECKSGVKNDGRLISKDHCNQLLGSVSWFRRNYDNSCTATPVLIEPVNRFQPEASPSQDMRIIDDEKLRLLREAIRSFGRSVASLIRYDNHAAIASYLDGHGFTAAKFPGSHTKGFTK